MKSKPSTTSPISHLPDLESYKLLDTLMPDEFDRIAELTALVCDVSAENVNLIGKDRLWFKYHANVQTEEIPAHLTLCAELSTETGILVRDLGNKPDKDHRAVRNEPPARSLVCVPLVNMTGGVFASLCILDHRSAPLSEVQRQALNTIAIQLTTIMESKRGLVEAERANQELRTAEQSIGVFKQVMDSSVDAITIADLTQPDQPIVYMNQAFERLTGYSRYEVLGRNCRFLQGKDSQQPVVKAIREAIDKKTEFKGVIRNYRKDGTAFWNELSLLPIQDESGHVRYMLGEQRNRSIAPDLSPLKWTNEKHVTDDFEGLIGDSAAMSKLKSEIKAVARVDASVLIEGETGTGKELVAKAIHKLSPRAKHPFIAINCAGLSETLLSSQLFGHKRGSFTGAIDNAQGVFEAANNGTLFLDEIGDMPASLQMALLRVLQEKEITRVGENSPRKVNVRVIAATHRDLGSLVEEKQFREDLLYRIKVARINTPSLRNHSEDISQLAKHFMRQLNATSPRQISHFSLDANSALSSYRWPGNVRELRSAIEYAFIQCRGDTIELCDLPPEIITPKYKSHEPNTGPLSKEEQIEDALRRTSGNRNEAAKLLGMSRATFFRRLAKIRKS